MNYNPYDQAPHSSDSLPNIDGFKFLELVGRGGMGAVYKARQLSLGRIVAIKVLPPDLISDDASRERFWHEAKIQAHLNHRNIVTVYDYGVTDSGEPFLVLEWMESSDLQRHLRTHGPFNEQKAVHIVTQVLDALMEAHKQQILHRDIKPDNVFLNANGEVKIGDFGIAKLMTALESGTVLGSLTAPNQTPGTPDYMAPELFESEGQPSVASDIYSTTILFQELITGKYAKDLLDDVPEKHKEAIKRGLSERPEERFHSAATMSLALLGAVANSPDIRILDKQVEIGEKILRLGQTRLSDLKDIFGEADSREHYGWSPDFEPPFSLEQGQRSRYVWEAHNVRAYFDRDDADITNPLIRDLWVGDTYDFSKYKGDIFLFKVDWPSRFDSKKEYLMRHGFHGENRRMWERAPLREPLNSELFRGLDRLPTPLGCLLTPLILPFYLLAEPFAKLWQRTHETRFRNYYLENNINLQVWTSDYDQIDTSDICVTGLCIQLARPTSLQKFNKHVRVTDSTLEEDSGALVRLASITGIELAPRPESLIYLAAFAALAFVFRSNFGGPPLSDGDTAIALAVAAIILLSIFYVWGMKLVVHAIGGKFRLYYTWGVLSALKEELRYRLRKRSVHPDGHSH